MGLLDMLSSPAGIGLLSGVASYAANARRGVPINNLGRGLAGGLVGYQQANDQTDANATEKQQRELRDLQIQQARQAMEATTRGRQLAADAYKSATVPAKPGMPAAFNVGGQSFPDMGEAQRAAKSAFNVPTAALPGKPAGDMYSEAMGMPASLAPQPMGIANLGDAPIQEQPAQEATPGGIDRRKYLDAVLAAGPDHPLYGEANKQLLDQQKPITLGKTLLDPDTYKVIATDETWRDEQDATRQQRIEELNMRLEDRRIGREEQADLRRELAAQQDAYRRESLEVRRDALTQGNKPPSGYRFTPQGNLEVIPGGPAGKSQTVTEGERKAATLLRRLDFSEKQLQSALKDNAAAEKPGLVQNGLRAIGADTAANALTGSERQRVEAAQLDILDAALTLGTGAAYTKEQLNSYRQSYFPQLGDKPEQIRDKAARLKNIVEAAKIAAGRAAPSENAKPTRPPTPKPAQSFSLPPNAKQYEGKTLRDTVSGKRYRAAGGKWQEVR